MYKELFSIKRGVVMLFYIFKRVCVSIFILFGVSFLLYGICRMTPVDYVTKITSGNQNITKEMEEKMRKVYGLDKGILEGYNLWLQDAFKGDFGISFIYQEPVTVVIKKYLGATVFLAGIAMLLEIVIAIPFGMIAAKRKYTKIDYTIVTISIISISLPSFFIAAVLKRVFAMELGLFPLSGMVTARTNYVGFAHLADMAWHFTLPVAVLVITSVGGLLRYVRVNMLEVLEEDYIYTARAKGLPEWKVLGKHGFRNTLIPLVTIVGGMIPNLFSGAVITEGVFGLEGLGSVALNAVYEGDIPYLMGFNMLIAVMTLVGTLVSDILYAVVDPRIRFK